MKGMGRREFERHKAEIMAEVKALMPIKAVWEQYPCGVSYPQFWKYVQKAKGAGTSHAPAPTAPRGNTDDRQQRPPGGGGEHNPVADESAFGPGFFRRK